MQKITLILGGTRSGKSAHGEMLALKNFSSPIYIFTAQAWDDEMKSRIKTHKKRREGKNWKDIEAPIELGTAIKNNAISNNNYIPLADLPAEDYDEEYLAMALESFFGLWAHDPEGNHWAGGSEYRSGIALLCGAVDCVVDVQRTPEKAPAQPRGICSVTAPMTLQRPSIRWPWPPWR